MSAELRAAAASSPAGALLPVAVWMHVDTSAATAAVVAAHPEGDWIGERPNSRDPATQRSLRRALEEARAAEYARAAAELDAAVAGQGGRVAYVSQLAPLAYVDTPASSLGRLASLERVASMGLEGSSWQTSLASAGPYVHADWHSGTLDQGTGTRVGIIEYYNVRATGDLAGKVVAYHNEGGSTTYEPGTGDHPSWVAGAIASQDSTDTGIAPGSLIVSSASGFSGAGLTRDRNVIRAADWAATTGDSDILNLSVNMDSGTGSAEARAYFDSIGGGESFRTVVASAGNYNTGYESGWLVTSPGTSWNVLTVGGVNDGTGKLWYSASPPEGAKLEDDRNATYNPHKDFNKPNVSAPAVSVRTANGRSGTGTSVASPIVAGVAAQVFARSPAVFAAWPEAMRAIVMAGAIRRVPLPGTNKIDDDHEGVGTVDAYKSNQIFVNGTVGGWSYGALTASNRSVSRTFAVAAGQKVRVAVSWDSHTSGPMFGKTDTLTADLDLRVYYPGGSRFSVTWDNNYEYVSFTAPSSGTVTIDVTSPRFDGSVEYYGLAWVHW